MANETLAHVLHWVTISHFIPLQFAIWNLISIGLNVVVVLIYNEVGLLKEVKHGIRGIVIFVCTSEGSFCTYGNGWMKQEVLCQLF